MAAPTANQFFHLLLGDIAMAAAISTYDPGYSVAQRPGNYAPGRLRDDWLAQAGDGALRQRVVGLANAGMGALQRMEQETLTATAARYGIPIDAAVAQEVAEHFERRRNAVLRYRR
ncbi:hypothetical protein [Imhoffiella purpurea]|uniref:Uncharacterized protein n=1 Tax=Imhoffiella purpurea TaxID=1249627 RepID=W9VIF9_9GAMM|nr:hypothetical protein [Imhoffiella purpurea]EXJ15812.1 hypothetical protein D779_1036 [Imhoffiella purpurea]